MAEQSESLSGVPDRGIDADSLPESEQALAYYQALRGGARRRASAEALRLALERFPDEAGLLSGASLPAEPGRSDAPEALTGDALGAMMARAYRRRRAAALGGVNTVADAPVAARGALTGILARLTELGLEIAALADALRLTRSLLVKLDRRAIDPATLPGGLVRELAARLAVTPDALSAFLAAPPRLSPAAEYKARAAPRAARRQSFRAAVAAAQAAGELTAQQAAAWLRELDA